MTLLDVMALPDWEKEYTESNTAQPLQVLIVDDEPMIRWTIAEALRDRGFSLVEAGTVAAALKTFDQLRPDIALLDIHLPDGSGLELLREFKSRHPETAVVIITGEVVVDNTIAALRWGADDFIGKPIRLDELENALNRITASRAQSSEVATKKANLLAVSDSAERLSQLTSALQTANTEIAGAISPEELKHRLAEKHDLVVVDLAADELKEALRAIRANPDHAEVSILVATGRIAADPRVSGVLPAYRAMPCNQTELLALAKELTAASEKGRPKRIL